MILIKDESFYYTNALFSASLDLYLLENFEQRWFFKKLYCTGTNINKDSCLVEFETFINSDNSDPLYVKVYFCDNQYRFEIVTCSSAQP